MVYSLEDGSLQRYLRGIAVMCARRNYFVETPVDASQPRKPKARRPALRRVIIGSMRWFSKSLRYLLEISTSTLHRRVSSQKKTKNEILFTFFAKIFWEKE